MKTLVTGGSGFLGAGLVKELLEAGHHVRVLDDHSRGRPARLENLDVELVQGDVRNYDDVLNATRGCEVVWHLAYINGTRYFYERPDDVLEVGVKGAINTIEAALAENVRRYVLASTSETYNNPTKVPTDESEWLKIPDVTNPRFSYGGGKIASELLTLHLGGKRGLETVIFRPHNFYGPDMGFEHVIPEWVAKLYDLSAGLTKKRVTLPIQGDGSETRAFCYIDDGARGSFLAGEKGQPGHIYHVGVEEELAISDLATRLGAAMGLEVEIAPGELRPGGTPRRCPAIGKLAALGYEPKVSLDEGLRRTAEWYVDHLRTRAKATA